MKYFVLILLLLVSACSFELGVSIPEEKGSISPVMCQEVNCETVFTDYISKARESVDCAFYDLELESLISELNSSDKKVRIVLDDYTYEVNHDMYVEMHGFIREDKYSSLMHNKFCVIDKKIIITGSFNPTVRGRDSNDNNVVVIESKYIAQNYEDEFEEIWNGLPKKNRGVRNPIVMINGSRIENYFCPDDCNVEIFTDLIDSANDSIHFMVFSFTKDEIGDALVKAHSRGVDVSGVMEKSQNNKWVEYPKLIDAGVNISWDNNKANMHHKVFVIDERVVITGSTNPSNNGLTRNDENIIVIHDDSVAKEYLDEFERIDSIIQSLCRMNSEEILLQELKR